MNQEPNVIIPRFRCMLILLLRIVCLSYSKQLWFKLLVSGVSKGLHAVCFLSNNIRDLYYYCITFKSTLVWLLAYVLLWSGWVKSMSLSQSCVTLAQQDIKNAKGHLKMIAAAHSGMFRGVNNPPHHLQFTAPKLSPGYAYELLTRLSLKNEICSGPALQTPTQPLLKHGESI